MKRIYRYIKSRIGLFFWSLIKDYIPVSSTQPPAPPSAAPSGTPPQPPAGPPTPMKKSFTDKFFDWWFWVLEPVLASAALINLAREAWLSLVVTVAVGIAIAALAINVVPPVAKGIVLRFGKRIVVGYYREVMTTTPDGKPDGKEVKTLQQLTQDQVDSAGFDPSDPAIVKKYKIKDEGWCIMFPVIERMNIFSLKIIEQIIKQPPAPQKDQTEEGKERRDDIYTKDGILIDASMLAIWRIKDLGEAFEFAPAENQEKLEEAVAELMKASLRTAFGECELKEEALRKGVRLTEDNKHIVKGGKAKKKGKKDESEWVLLNDMIMDDSKGLLASWGIQLLSVRIQAIGPVETVSRDVFDALEEIQKQQFKKESDTIDANRDLAVRTIKAGAQLVEAEKEAEGNSAKIRGLMGKKSTDPIEEKDADKFIRLTIGGKVADALGKDTKVIAASGGVFGDVFSLAALFKEAVK